MKQLVTKVMKLDQTLYLSDVADILEIPYSTLLKYRTRIRNAQEPVMRPGPKPVAPPDMRQVQREIQALDHGRKRSKGIGFLKEKYRNKVPRRIINRLAADVRSELNREQDQLMDRIRWNQPGSVWSMDDAEFIYRGQKFWIHQIQDMASKYKMPPMVGDEPANGEEIAANLRSLFRQFGAPLFLKRDNGGNLNHAAVQEVLQEFHVIPINSPAYYPKYNGSMERGQRDLKEMIRQKIEENIFSPSHSLGTKCDTGPDCGGTESFTWLVQCAAHDCNHISRPVLEGGASCPTFLGAGKYRKHKRKRQEVFEWISNVSLDIYAETRHSNGAAFDAAWRQAAVKWLQDNGLISVWKKSDVLPN